METVSLNEHNDDELTSYKLIKPDRHAVPSVLAPSSNCYGQYRLSYKNNYKVLISCQRFFFNFLQAFVDRRFSQWPRSGVLKMQLSSTAPRSFASSH